MKQVLNLSLLVCLFLLDNLSVVAAPIKVSFSSPGNRTTVTSPTSVSVNAQGSPRNLTLYVDGKQTKEIKSSNLQTSISLSAGNHTLKATAFYSSRSSSSASISVTVKTASTTGTGSTGGSTSVAQQIAADMEGPNEGQPHGVPSGWFDPSLGEGNNPQGNAVEFWGGVYVGPNGNPATNTLVNIKNCSVYLLSRSTGKWSTTNLSASDLDGGFYSETFSVDYGTSIPMRHESDGSVSFNTVAGKVAHFYGPWPRLGINPSDFDGMVTTCDARLILNDANGNDDRSIAEYLLDVGADPYPTTTGPGIENNPNIGMGKFKYVKSDWRSFSMSTLTESQLAQNPPPVSFTGINP